MVGSDVATRDGVGWAEEQCVLRGVDPAVRAFVDRLPFGLLIAAGILYYTLPQAIFAVDGAGYGGGVRGRPAAQQLAEKVRTKSEPGERWVSRG